MSIRTVAAHAEGIYKNKFNKQLNRLDTLHKKLDQTNDIITTQEINEQSAIEKNSNNELLERRGKYLANRARLNWIEKGEKNNKYFMNLIKSNSNKQSINELIINDTSTKDQESFLGHIFDFYNYLYNNTGDKTHR